MTNPPLKHWQWRELVSKDHLKKEEPSSTLCFFRRTFWVKLAVYSSEKKNNKVFSDQGNEVETKRFQTLMRQDKPRIWVIFESILRKLKSEIYRSHLPKEQQVCLQWLLPSFHFSLLLQQIVYQGGIWMGKIYFNNIPKNRSLTVISFKSELSGRWEEQEHFKDLPRYFWNIICSSLIPLCFKSLYIYAQMYEE